MSGIVLIIHGDIVVVSSVGSIRVLAVVLSILRRIVLGIAGTVRSCWGRATCRT